MREKLIDRALRWSFAWGFGVPMLLWFAGFVMFAEVGSSGPPFWVLGSALIVTVMWMTGCQMYAHILIDRAYQKEVSHPRCTATCGSN